MSVNGDEGRRAVTKPRCSVDLPPCNRGRPHGTVAQSGRTRCSCERTGARRMARTTPTGRWWRLSARPTARGSARCATWGSSTPGRPPGGGRPSSSLMRRARKFNWPSSLRTAPRAPRMKGSSRSVWIGCAGRDPESSAMGGWGGTCGGAWGCTRSASAPSMRSRRRCRGRESPRSSRSTASALPGASWRSRRAGMAPRRSMIS